MMFRRKGGTRPSPRGPSLSYGSRDGSSIGRGRFPGGRRDGHVVAATVDADDAGPGVRRGPDHGPDRRPDRAAERSGHLLAPPAGPRDPPERRSPAGRYADLYAAEHALGRPVVGVRRDPGRPDRPRG